MSEKYPHISRGWSSPPLCLNFHFRSWSRHTNNAGPLSKRRRTYYTNGHSCYVPLLPLPYYYHYRHFCTFFFIPEKLKKCEWLKSLARLTLKASMFGWWSNWKKPVLIIHLSKEVARRLAPSSNNSQKKPEEGVRWELTNVTVFILVIFSEWSLVQNVVVWAAPLLVVTAAAAAASARNPFIVCVT